MPEKPKEGETRGKHESQSDKKDDATASQNKKRPVIIHRALLGSVERMMAILTENYGGKWPFWLSPRQAIVIPIASAHDTYALAMHERLKLAGFQCET